MRPPKALGGGLAAVILDMDGVLVDSEHQWLLAEQGFFREILGRWSVRDNHKLVGVVVEDIHRMLARDHGLTMGLAEFVARCDAMAPDIYRRRVSLARGLPPFLAGLRRRGLGLAVASSSPKTWVDMVMERFRLRPLFDAVVSGDEAPGRTKPAPDLYLLAARRLGARPGSCLAVEDSTVGVRAAKAAGMTCVGLRTRHNKAQDLSAADWEARGFGELAYRSIVSRLKAA